MKITLSMTVNELLEKFEKEFGVTLGIYKGAKNSSNITLLEISDPRKKRNASINVQKETMVGSFEAMFTEHFGIRVQVKDKNGNTVPQDIILGSARDLSKAYSLVDEIPESNEAENKNKLKEEDIVSDEEKQKKHRGKLYIVKAKTVNSIQDSFNEIDKFYIEYQKNEKYSKMLKLLSSMEKASLTFPSSYEIREHIDQIKNKSYNISIISIKKRRFVIFVMSIITVTVLIAAFVGFSVNTYKKIKAGKKLDSLITDIDNLRERKNTVLISGNTGGAFDIDKTIEQKTSEMEQLRDMAQSSVVNYFLIISAIFSIIIAVLTVRLNRYSVTSTRFKDEVYKE